MNRVDLKYIAESYGRFVPDDVQLVERNGRIFFLHRKWRYDPLTLFVLTAVGGGIGIAGTLKQGKEQEKLAKARAQIDIDNDAAVRTRSVEEATIRAEKRRRTRATAKATAAAGNIRVNQGSPLVIDTQILADATKDIGFGLERGRVESGAFRSSAALEIAAGKQAKKKSRFDALKMGLGLAIGLSGMAANLPGKPTVATSKFTPLPGGAPGLKIRSGPTELGTFFA